MKYLLDTRLLAELVRAKPEEWVVNWFDILDEDEVCLSLLTIGEIIKGIEQLEDPGQKQRMYDWLNNDLLIRFYGRIVPLDMEVIAAWGKITAKMEASGKTISTVDGLTAATVLAKDLVLITRDVNIFTETGIQVSDPWQG